MSTRIQKAIKQANTSMKVVNKMTNSFIWELTTKEKQQKKLGGCKKKFKSLCVIKGKIYFNLCFINFLSKFIFAVLSIVVLFLQFRTFGSEKVKPVWKLKAHKKL